MRCVGASEEKSPSLSSRGLPQPSQVCECPLAAEQPWMWGYAKRFDLQCWLAPGHQNGNNVPISRDES